MRTGAIRRADPRRKLEHMRCRGFHGSKCFESNLFLLGLSCIIVMSSSTHRQRKSTKISAQEMDEAGVAGGKGGGEVGTDLSRSLQAPLCVSMAI